MSAAITPVSAVSIGTYRTSAVIGAFTPNANRLLLCLTAFPEAGASVSGIVGHGTWSAINTIASATNKITLWGCITSGSPSSGTVTVSHSSASSLVHVFEVSAGYGAASVAASIVQSATLAEYVTATPTDHEISVTLAAFANASNLTLIVVSVSGSLSTFTEQGSLTQDYEINTSPYSINMSSLEGADTSPSVLSTSDYINQCAIAMEIAVVGGGGGTPPRNLLLLGCG